MNDAARFVVALSGSPRPGSNVDGLVEAALDAAREAFAPLGSLAVDQPFRGTYVPLRHHGRDDRVESIMLEVRRDACLRADGAADDAAIDRLAGAAARLIDGLATS